jgi:hypothetical protein
VKNTFPSTGAMPMITDARAARTCCDESVDNSCKCSLHYYKDIVHPHSLLADSHRRSEKGNSLNNKHHDRIHYDEQFERALTLTQGRMCCEATCGLTIAQNLVTLLAAAIRTSASLSRSSRPYAGTSSVLIPSIHKNECPVSLHC